MASPLSRPLLLILLCCLPCLLLAQNGDTIIVGDFLAAADPAESWLSPSGDFAFGFRQLENKNLYLLAICYNKISDKTIVWYANGDDPAPTGSKVELTADRGLVLTSPQGKEIWKSGINIGDAARGMMNDTGNFRIVNTGGEKLWQTFDDPKDTLLPGQALERGGKILSSRLRETNFSRGRFQFRLIPDGNGVLNANNLRTGDAYDAYYWTNTVDANLSNAGLRIVFNESGYLYTLRASNKRELITPERVVPTTEYYHRVTLNFDGVLTQYSHPKNSTDNGNWSIIFSAPENICFLITDIGTGPCGFNSVCQLNADQRAICRCPPRFSSVDPGDDYAGCKPDFSTQFCEDAPSTSPEDYDFLELTNTDWPTSDYERYDSYNIEECQKACIQDCFCNVVVFRGSCWKKKLPLSNGRQSEKVNGRAFIKVRKDDYMGRGLPPRPFPNAKEDQDSLVLVISVLLGSSVFINFILIGLVTFCFLFFYHKKSTGIPQGEKSNLRCFSYKELVEATKGFKEELGRGSFGIVYKGLIEMGTTVPVAVKKLDRVVEYGEKEYKAEVKAIGQTHHKNLVQLLGFCDEGQQKLLVYELLSNGTLANFLFGDTKLSWKQRTQIAFGIARGLVYLHEECNTQIIHCDIKPQNILVDEYYDAKISDFGLAKLLLLDQSQTFTTIRGTKGYVAPEWFRNVPITVKVDAYSFGVLLLEIICSRRSVDTEISGERAILTDWAYDCYMEGRIDDLVENDEEALSDLKKVERFLMVAIWCIQEDPTLRPTMKTVILMLEGIIQVAVPPCPCPCPFSVVS
ncbi:G-type lectin S-receptor-like serine/threonine-protein kinase RLK1 [Ricinus communis]|uniref:Receptor-like serine/threonine-protein kinase n=1 Tax=Ricinus communis TaxID=3988 RepID=B9RI65_RICCO|nr:G-type lectin S-receptor-like serine/threonine-protein kinase RLK1 [Ricinus communis]EEF48837.1 ATP binding protein, putative [Ricinus communis]|eukprot:XP_002513434.1 G-type lectin S-receptor-like serine/threonine-protein kinase RLK1 [Ricinus communis]